MESGSTWRHNREGDLGETNTQAKGAKKEGGLGKAVGRSSLHHQRLLSGRCGRP